MTDTSTVTKLGKKTAYTIVFVFAIMNTAGKVIDHINKSNSTSISGNGRNIMNSSLSFNVVTTYEIQCISCTCISFCSILKM